LRSTTFSPKKKRKEKNASPSKPAQHLYWRLLAKETFVSIHEDRRRKKKNKKKKKKEEKVANAAAAIKRPATRWTPPQN
jgi:hypothetical protein